MLKTLFMLCFMILATTARAECLQDGYPIADQCSERIPPVCIQGILNQRFQWVPGYADIPIYLIQKYHVIEWARYRALPWLRKYVPVFAQWESDFEKGRNAVILATPLVLKLLKKF